MTLDWRTVRGHTLVVAAVAIGIVGMEMVFSGAMDGDLHELSRGVPLLLMGLWWAGRELGRSMRVSRTRRMVEASQDANVPATGVDSEKGRACGHH